ncbi:hypothetical protein D9M70_290610 [compost metagenome]
MRIDGFSSSYSLDRSARTGTAVAPYREVQKEAEPRREAPQPTVAPATRAASGGDDRLPVSLDSVTYQRPLSSHATQALASYSSTASYSTEVDALEVLGLDLYA